MLARLLVFVLLSIPAIAQDANLLAVGLAPVDREMTKQILGKRASKLVTVWVVVLNNHSPERVVVAESWVLSRIIDLTPYDHKTLAPVIAVASRKDPWATAGRLMMDAAVLATFFGGGGVIAMSEPVLAGLAGFSALSPRIADRLKGEAIPVLRNFEEMSWTEPISLEPGQSATTHVFTAYKDGAHYRSYAESVDESPKVKFVQ